jgi:hypothetical protein
MRFLGTEELDFSCSLDRHSTKVTVSCCLLHDRAIEPFIFHEIMVEWNSYLDMQENYALPQLLQVQDVWGLEITLQQGAPPHWANDGRM